MVPIGGIADDYTGATDLAAALCRAGLRVTQLFGCPGQFHEQEATDAVIIALKTRSAPVQQAVSQSLEAAEYLSTLGAQRLLFKICSTFDSTPQGNIGPVSEQLLDHLGCKQAIVCPAFPANGRTLYQGHLFVDGRPLNESGMRHHPLTPMTDANLIRVLGAQTSRAVGLVSYPVIELGAEHVRLRLQELAKSNIQFALTDVLNNEHLAAVAHASHDYPLIIGGSAIGEFMPIAWRKLGVLSEQRYTPHLRRIDGFRVVLSGSCSERTQQQLNYYAQRFPTYKVEVGKSPTPEYIDSIVQWAMANLNDKPLIYTTCSVEELKAVQTALGVVEAAAQAEMHLSLIARGLADAGFRKFVIAGGETAGSIVKSLGIEGIHIGPEICTGVPWTQSLDGRYSLALKSGNFGAEDFFLNAWQVLDAEQVVN